MRIPRREFEEFFEKGVTKHLRIAAHPLSRDVAGKRVLFRVTPRTLPGWTVEIRSSHDDFMNRRHLILKWALEDLNRNEIYLFQILAVKNSWSEERFLIDKFILVNLQLDRDLRQNLIKALELEKYFFPGGDPERVYRSFNPQIMIERLWTERVRLPPKRYIGVGYKDQGHLSSTPSWKEQQLPDVEEDPTSIPNLKNLLRRFRRMYLSRLRVAPTK